MKKTIALLLVIFAALTSYAQQASLSITIQGAKSKQLSLWKRGAEFELEELDDEDTDLTLRLGTGNTVTKELSLTEPTFYTLSYEDKAKKLSVNYDFYLSPGDQIKCLIDLQKSGELTITGKGSDNNQPSRGGLDEEFDHTPFYGEREPNRFLDALNSHLHQRREKFERYIKKHHPTASLVRDWGANLSYFGVLQYYLYQQEHRYRVKKEFKNYEHRWLKAQDSLLKNIKLDNQTALAVPSYTQFLGIYLEDTIYRLNTMTDTAARNAYFNDLYNNNSSGLKIDQGAIPLLKEKFISTYFKGRTLEFLYVKLFDPYLADTDLDKDLPIVFGHFKTQFPNNRQLKVIQPFMERITARQQAKLNPKMIFLPKNGTSINTFDELVTLTKGKTVLLDMWGTWCGPCREEMDRHGEQLKTYFKGKGLDFLYIANDDINHEMEWKKLIAFYNLEGTHILANAQLTKDIMSKVKGKGYPTYVILKKDGSFELSRAGFPLDRSVLIAQIDEALK